MFLIGLILGLMVWGLIALSFVWSGVNYFMEDGEGGYKLPLWARTVRPALLSNKTTWFEAIVFWTGMTAPVSFGILAVLAQFLLFNIVIPIVVVALVGMAFLGRMVKRMKKVFTKHVGDASIHRKGAAE